MWNVLASNIMDLSNIMDMDKSDKNRWDNRDINLRKKNKKLDYGSKKFCDRFINKKG